MRGADAMCGPAHTLPCGAAHERLRPKKTAKYAKVIHGQTTSRLAARHILKRTRSS